MRYNGQSQNLEGKNYKIVMRKNVSRKCAAGHMKEQQEIEKMKERKSGKSSMMINSWVNNM